MNKVMSNTDYKIATALGTTLTAAMHDSDLQYKLTCCDSIVGGPKVSMLVLMLILMLN